MMPRPLKAMPGMEPKRKTMFHRPLRNFKFKTRTCLCVAIARGAFRSRVGIAYFVKVGPRDENATFSAEGDPVLLDDLFICDACDMVGVPDLMCSSGRHTQGHHLIRCQAPEEGGDTSSPTEQRLLSVESRLDDVKTQLDDLTHRMGDLHGRVGDLTGSMGDLNSRVVDLTGGTGNLNGVLGELTGSIASLTGRIADIEQLLYRLAGTANNAV